MRRAHLPGMSALPPLFSCGQVRYSTLVVTVPTGTSRSIKSTKTHPRWTCDLSSGRRLWKQGSIVETTVNTYAIIFCARCSAETQGAARSDRNCNAVLGRRPASVRLPVLQRGLPKRLSNAVVLGRHDSCQCMSAWHRPEGIALYISC